MHINNLKARVTRHHDHLMATIQRVLASSRFVLDQKMKYCFSFDLWAIIKSSILLILIAALYANFSGKDMTTAQKFVSVAVTVGLLCFFRYWLPIRKITPEQWHKIGMSVVILGSCLAIAWALVFDSIQYSDFGRYFTCGMDYARHADIAINLCQTPYMHKNLIYWERSLFYTAPIQYFINGNYDGLKIINAVLHGGTLVLWHSALKRRYNSAFAAISTFAVLIYPEWWFSITLATPDNLAMPMLMIFLILLSDFFEHDVKYWHWACLIIVTYITAKLRTIAPLLILTAILTIFLYARKKWAAYGARLAFVFFGYLLLSKLISPAVEMETIDGLKTLSALDFHTHQDFTTNYPWGQYFWYAVPEEFRWAVAIKKLFLELLYGMQNLPGYLSQKAGTLFNGTGYYGFSSFNFDGYNPDTVFTVPKSTVPWAPEMAGWWTALTSIYVSISAFAIPSLKKKLLNAPACIFIFIFFLLVVGISESQPRYSVLLVPALALFIPQALLATTDSNYGQMITRKTEAIKTAIATIVCAGLIIIIIYVSGAVQGWYHNPMLEMTTAVSNTGEIGNGQCARPLAVETNYKAIKVHLNEPGDCSILALNVSTNARYASFFINSNEMPFLWQKAPVSTIRYQVMVGDKTLLDDSLGETSVKWYRIKLPAQIGARRRELRILMKKTTEGKAETIEFSLYMES